MPRYNQKKRSFVMAVTMVLLFGLIGAGLVIASQRIYNSPGNEGVNLADRISGASQTVELSPTSKPEPVQIQLGQPQGVEACTSGVMTFMPEGVDPLGLPPIVPIQAWYAAQNYLQAAFVQITVKGVSPSDPVELANRVLVRVVGYEPMPGPANTAFALCESQPPLELPTLRIDRTAVEFTKELGEVETLTLDPFKVQTFDLKLMGADPGLYTLNLGVEVLEDGQMHSVWSGDQILIKVPERINRWSGELLVNWGECLFQDGEYACSQEVPSDPENLEALLALAITPTPTGRRTPGATDENVLLSDPPEMCSGSPQPRLEPGEAALVAYDIGTRLRVRTLPGIDQDIIGGMRRGTRLKLIAGPVCKTGIWWYQIESNDGQFGWSAEGEDQRYYLVENQ